MLTRITLITGLIWIILLFWLFPPGSLLNIVIALANFLILSLFTWMTDALADRKRWIPAISIPLILYITASLHFYDGQRQASAADEIRAAIRAAFAYDDLPEAVAFQIPEPPFAVLTAASHRYAGELPDHSWFIRTSGPEAFNEDELFWFNTRDGIAGTDHPGLVGATSGEEYLNLTIQELGDPVTFRIPLSERAPMTLNPVDYPTSMTAEVIPHYLSPPEDARFQNLYYSFLNALY